MIYIAGLVLIIAGLAAQAYKTLIRKDRGLSPIFLALLAVGGVAFVVDDFTRGGTASGILDIIGTILIAIVFIALLTRRKTL